MIDGPQLPWVMESGAHNCRVFGSGLGSTTSGKSCDGEPAFAVEVHYPHDGSVWLNFLCVHHGAEVPDARPVTTAERAEIAHRAAEHTKAMSGQPYKRTEPLRPGRRRR